MNILNHVTILAAMSSELFDEGYTVGQIGLIQWLKDNAGLVVCWVISAVGFLIVAAAILKNALAGLYLAYPKLWDKVYEMRKQMESGLSASGGGGGGGEKIKQKASAILMLVFSILPDVKSATEFDTKEGGSDAFTKKQWLTTAIPEFLALVMIGMLIFYGYPTKLANWVGSTGTYVMDAFFDNVDPVQLVKKVATNIGTYDLVTDDATSPFENNVNIMARSAIKQIYTRYSDMQTGPLQQTATEVETTILKAFQASEDAQSKLSNPDGYTVSVAVQLTATQPIMNDSFSQAVGSDGKTGIRDLYVAKSSSGTVMYKYYFQTRSLPTGSTKVGDNDYVVITVNAVPASQAVVNSAKVAYVYKNFKTDQLKTTDNKLSLNGKYNVAGGIYVTEGAPVEVRTFKGGVVDKTFSGTFHSSGGSAYVLFTGTVTPKVQAAIGGSGLDYVEIVLPEKSYTTYTATKNGADVTTKVTVLAIRGLMSNSTDAGYINVAWSDYISKDCKPTATMDDAFFSNKASK